MTKSVKSETKSVEKLKQPFLRKYWQINKRSAVLLYKLYCGDFKDKKKRVPAFCIHSFYPSDEDDRHLVKSSKKVILPFYHADSLISAIQKIKPKSIQKEGKESYWGDFKFPKGSIVIQTDGKKVITKNPEVSSFSNITPPDCFRP